MGGGSVFAAIKTKHPKALYRVNDLNNDVYCFWSTLQKKPDEFQKAVLEIKKGCSDGKSLHRKLSQSKTAGVFGKALRYYVLNRISYSGTVDSGGYSAESFEKRFTLSKIEMLPTIADLLKKVRITNKSYEELLFKKGEDVFIFLDPPYWTPRKTALYGKKGDLNKFFNHQQFAECQEM